MTTGERIKQRRKELGISADTVADAMGVSRASVFRYENGGIEKLPITALEPLARVLCTSVEYLMGWEESKEAPTQAPECEVTDSDIKFALFGDTEIDDEVLDEVKRFAEFAKNQYKERRND